MILLNAHIEAEEAVFTDGSILGNASELLPLDHASRWDEIQDSIKIATAVSVELTGLISRECDKLWSLVINVFKKLLKEDMVREKETDKAALAKKQV